jgi:hypothetical protein
MNNECVHTDNQTVKKSREIDDVISSLTSSTGRLLDVITELEKRLTPLCNQTESSVNKDTEYFNRTQIGGNIQLNVGNVQEVINRIENILDKLEI